MTRFTRFGLMVIASVVLINQPLVTNAHQASVFLAQAEKPATQSNPKAVIDQFYRAYVSQNKTWRDLKELIDPATYNQLSRVERFDVEPFTDAQVRTWTYTIGTPTITGNQAKVPIRLMVGLRRAEVPRNLTIVLRKNSDVFSKRERWQIRNVIYSAKPLPSGKPNDLLSLWKPKLLSDDAIVDLIAKLPEVQQMRKAVESYQGEKLKLGISIDESATASNPVATVGVYEYHTDHRTTLQRFLVNAQTQEIRVVDPLTSRSISLEQWRKHS